MKTQGLSCILAITIIFFGIGTRNVLADEKCSENRGNRLREQTFGMALTPDDFLTSMFSPHFFPWPLQDYFRPWRHLASLTKDLGSTIKTEKDKFQINLDVQHFAPDEITVKTVDGFVVVEAKHEEKEDQHGYVSRQFVRRYSLPEGAEAEDVVSQLSSDGILTISAPRKPVEVKGERMVPITQTGPVRREAKEQESQEKQGSCLASEKSCTKA